MIRRSRLLALALLLALLAVPVAVRTFDSARVAAVDAPRLEHTSAPVARVEAGRDPGALATQREDAATPQVAPVPVDGVRAGPASHVRALGRVIDQRGRGVANAQIELALRELGNGSARETSAEPVVRCFRARSDASGRFELELPLLDAAEASLAIDPPAAFARASAEIKAERLRLVPGPCQLGEHLVTDAQRVYGRVLDELDRPVVGAELRLGADVATTEFDGSYAFERTALGDLMLYATKPGLSPESASTFKREPGPDGLRIDFRMQRAPSISGIVLEPDGTPAAGAYVLAHYESAGGCGNAGQHPVIARSGADGRFELFLLEIGDHRLGAFRSIAGRPPYSRLAADASPLVAPGTHDLRLVLAAPRSAHFEVRDKHSGAPVERCGVVALGQPASAWKLDGLPPTRSIPGGRLQIEIDEWSDGFRCEAPGYASAVGAISPTSSADAPQVVELSPGACLRGRVADGAQALVVLRRCELPLANDAVAQTETAFEPPNCDDRIFGCGLSGPRIGYDLDEYAGRERRMRCAPDGSFAFEDLHAGTYQLIVHTAGSAATRFGELRLEAGQLRDLGKIETQRAASIEGRVLLAPGFSPEGLKLSLWHAPCASFALERDGRFAFGGLGSAQYSLYVQDDADRCLAVPPLVVSVQSGERHELVWDLRAWQPASLELKVTEKGRGVSGVEVETRSSTDLWWGDKLGTTDSSGVLRCSVPSLEGRSWLVRTPTGIPLAERRIELPFGPGEQRQVELELACGALRAQWSERDLPAAFFEDPHSFIACALIKAGAENSTASFRIPASTPYLDLHVSRQRTFELDRVAPGRWKLIAYAHTSTDATPLSETSTEFEIRPGELTTALLDD